MKITLTTLMTLCLLGPAAQAGGLTQARITKIVNEVSVVDSSSQPRRAELQDVIKDQIGLKTGIKSRSELLFEDQTLTRIGPESYFSFKSGTRDMTLEQGTMLLQVPKGLGGARIRTAAITAAVTGTTILLEHRPKQNIKVLVLEGSLRLSANGTFGDSVLLEAGKMVIMRPDAKRIPDPVSIDLKKLMKTSSLVKMGGKGKPALPSVALIEKEIEIQAQNKVGDSLVDTNLVILGGGNEVLAASDTVLDALDRKDAVDEIMLAANQTPAQQPTPPPAALPTATPIILPTPGTTPPPTTPSPTIAPTPTPPPAATPTPAPSASPTAAPSATPKSSPSATPRPSATPGDDDDDDDDSGDDDDDSDEDGSSRLLNFGTSNNPLTTDVSLSTPIDLTNGHGSGTVNVTTKGSVAVNTTVKVSDGSESFKPSKRGGSVSLESRKTNGNAITISSSAQILSLLLNSAPGPGGTIKFTSAGGAVNVNGATVKANRGTIDIQNNGAGVINLNNTTMSADIIKANALGTNGQLNVGGGTISADSAIDLFASGSNGAVNFTDNVTLNGNSVKTISGHTVTVSNGKIVTIGGPAPASVFTNHPNYSGSGGNNSTTGTFGGKGATTRPLSASPPGK